MSFLVTWLGKIPDRKSAKYVATAVKSQNCAFSLKKEIFNIYERDLIVEHIENVCISCTKLNMRLPKTSGISGPSPQANAGQIHPPFVSFYRGPSLMGLTLIFFPWVMKNLSYMMELPKLLDRNPVSSFTSENLKDPLQVNVEEYLENFFYFW